MVKVKEMKEDAIISIKVNRNFYLMVKALSFNIVKDMHSKNPEESYLKDCITKPYNELDDLQRSFYTTALLLSEIETQAKEQNMYVEKDILEPGDEGYVAPVIQD